MKQHYVLGLAINKARNKILLMDKQTPAWQKGLLNAVGGKIEFQETPLAAMVREFREETDLKTIESDWLELGFQENEHFKLFVFYTFTDDIFNAVTTTHETVRVHDINIEQLRTAGVDNLFMMVEAALKAP